MKVKSILRFLLSISFLIVLFIHDALDSKKFLSVKRTELSRENFYDVSSSIGEVFLASAAYKVFVYNNALNPFNIFAYNAIFIGGSFVMELLKHYVHEERPDKSNSHAFPSGHSFISILSLLFIFYAGTKRKFSIGNFSLCAIGVLVCAFRVLAMKHFLHDVFAGLSIGILSFFIGMKISKYLYEEFFEKIFKELGF